MLPNHPFAHEDKRFDAGKWLMIGLFFVLSFLMFYLLTLRPSSDINIHTIWAADSRFSDPISFVRHVAHPLWHVLVVALMTIGLPSKIAAALITALSKAAEMWLIHRLFTVSLSERFSRGTITLFAAVCGSVASICLPFYNPYVYYGVGTPNTWHSCTQVLVLVFMILSVPLTAWCYDSFETLLPVQGDQTRLPWKQPVTLGILLFVGLLAKPTFLQAFLPAACLYFLVQWIRHPKNSRYFVQILLCVLPAVVLMLLQYLYYFGNILSTSTSMEIQLSWQKVQDIAMQVLLLNAFPMYAIWTTRKQKWDTCYILTLLLNLIAILEILFLGEGGRRAQDGNFAWGLMGASLMLWIMCLIRFLKQTNLKKLELRQLPGWILLAWHQLTGIYYFIYLLFSGTPF